MPPASTTTAQRLTPELLERQIRSYYVMRELIDEWNLDFCGIKAQPELTDNFATMDVTEAFLNDPYDWDGPKPSDRLLDRGRHGRGADDADPASLSGTPVLFADVRHYHADLGIWDLCNSGQHATWFAARSDDPLENIAHVHLYPEEFYFPAGGASIHHLAAPGEFTFARLTRLGERYRMHVLRGRFEQFDQDTNETPHARIDLRLAARFRAPRRRRGRDPRPVRLESHPRGARRPCRGSALRSAGCSTSTLTASAGCERTSSFSESTSARPRPRRALVSADGKVVA